MSFLTERQYEMAKKIGELLTAHRESVSVAESSSGGLVSACLLSVPGASSFYVGGGVLYSYTIRKAIVGMGEKEHVKYGGSTPELIMDIAENLMDKLGTTWVIGEGGAAGPSKSPYGHNAGYTSLAVIGPVSRSKIIETGRDNRIENMVEFATNLLSFFLEVLMERHEGTNEK